MNKKIFIFIGIIVVMLLAIAFFVVKTSSQTINMLHTQTLAVKSVSSEISAQGNISAQDQATLHFQTGGKLVYLPFKEGDHISAGVTIAQLDTYALQRQLAAALNTYQSTRDSFDQTQQNSQDNVLQNQQKSALSNAEMDQSNAINDAVKRILDQNQSNLNTSVITVELSNYALQLSSLVSPISGIITHEDVVVPNQNVTTATSFVIADPNTMVFRAQVSQNDIDYVSVGADAFITINGLHKQYKGVVDKIYPAKITFADGTQGYNVDIVSSELKAVGKLDQGGNVLIKSNVNQAVTIIPRWVVLSGNMVWIERNGKFVLQKIQTGNIHGQEIEVLSGLSPEDKVVINPMFIIQGKYQIL